VNKVEKRERKTNERKSVPGSEKIALNDDVKKALINDVPEAVSHSVSVTIIIQFQASTMFTFC